MSRYKIHLTQGGTSLLLEHDAGSLEDLGYILARQRCLIGELVEEGGHLVEPSVRILLPSTRIHLVAQA